MEALAQDAMTLVRENGALAVPLTFLFAFAESIAFVSFLVPATVILVGLGALVGAGAIEFLPVWLAAAAGAVLGDALSYWFGWRFKARVAGLWPLSRSPDLLPRAEAFFKRWGMMGVFLGRFLGPMRATVPLAAGVSAMPLWRFKLATIASAFVWSAVMLAPGAFGASLLV
jgi:membrane protein DedA with SNARE-associated domain